MSWNIAINLIQWKKSIGGSYHAMKISNIKYQWKIVYYVTRELSLKYLSYLRYETRVLIPQQSKPVRAVWELKRVKILEVNQQYKERRHLVEYFSIDLYYSPFKKRELYFNYSKTYTKPT